MLFAPIGAPARPGRRKGSSMRKLPAMTAILLGIALASCGDEGKDGPFIPKKDLIEDPVTYFGMEPCTCYEYVRESEWAQNDPSKITTKLGVAVENVGAAKEFGKQVHIVRYRMGGNVLVRQDYLDPTSPELLLYGANPTGKTTAPFWQFEPAISFVRGPVEEGKVVSSTAKVSRITPPDQKSEGVESTFRAQYRPVETVEIGKYDEVEKVFHREAVEAYPISYRGASTFEQDDVWEGQTRWFVPERGFVKMKLNLAAQEDTWVLLHTRQLEECTPEGAEPRDWCGR